VVATEVAEISSPIDLPIGTAGGTGAGRVSVQMLRGGEFLRIALNDAQSRYLIHLPVAP
jgi:hypothetical protein